MILVFSSGACIFANHMMVRGQRVPVQRRPLNADPRPGSPGPDIEGGVLDAYPGSRVPRRASRRGIGKPDPRLGRPRAHVRRCRCSPALGVQRVLPARADDEAVTQIGGALRAVADRPTFRHGGGLAVPHFDDAPRLDVRDDFRPELSALASTGKQLLQDTGEPHYFTLTCIS